MKSTGRERATYATGVSGGRNESSDVENTGLSKPAAAASLGQVHRARSLDGAELAAIAGHWRGGSVRRLRRIVEVVLRERELRATRN